VIELLGELGFEGLQAGEINIREAVGIAWWAGTEGW